ncbi:MAG: hypothetical protein U0625_02655 [Phycisphaerales bacterium]
MAAAAIVRIRIRARCAAAAARALLPCAAFALALLPAPAAHAREVRPRVAAVVCSPGGVAAVPLARDAGDRWPERVAVSIGGLQAQAPVVWVGAAVDDGMRSWTRSPEQLTARAIGAMRDEERPESRGEVMALVELPAAGEGALSIGGRALETFWLPMPPRVRPDAPILPVVAGGAEDRPDAGTPNEYWRWSLLASRQQMRVGEPRGDAVEGLWARHVEGLWQGGLERVRRTSRGVHDELLDALTATAADSTCERPIAAWIARPSDLRALLSILIDPERSDEDAAQASLTWLRAHWMLTLWIEADCGDRVRIAVCNPTAGERIARFSWSGAAPGSLAVAIPVPPRSVERAWIDRVELQANSATGSVERQQPEVLEVADGALRTRVPVGAREYPVRPPGLSFSTFLPVLSLADAQSGTIVPPDPTRRTTASLRRRQGRWELFLECLRPESAPDPESDEVVVRIGAPDAPVRTVRVRASGSLLVEGGAEDGAGAGFMTWSDRWRARLEIPEAWLPSAAGAAQPLMLSVERRPGGPQPRQTAGLALPPWRATPPALLVDLAPWSGVTR